MEILPKKFGLRPQLAVEIRAGGVVAARAGGASSDAGILGAVARAELGRDAVEPGLKPGNIKARAAVVAAVKKTLEAVQEKGTGRAVTVVVPDAVVRVLLLDFDTLPTKAAEAMPLVRFRLKKLLPFEVEESQVSYQRMVATGGAGSSGSGGKELLKVVAVAIPKAVLDEYEGVIREAGFEPGAVLPSTLAALAGIEDEAGAAALVVNAGSQAVTTAIVENGVLLLHRSVDLSGNVQVGILAEALVVTETVETIAVLPLVDRDASQQEWAMQEALPPFGRVEGREVGSMDAGMSSGSMLIDTVTVTTTTSTLNGRLEEVVQAVSVAAAYYEDLLQRSPSEVLSAGSTGAEKLAAMLHEAGFGVVSDARTGESAVTVREIVGAEALGPQAATTRVPACWLAGVRGALRS